MVKNRVAPENKPNKNRGGFFKKPKKQFNPDSKFKYQQNTKKPIKFHQFSKENDKTGSLKPSVSGSEDFFVKPYDNGKNLEAAASKPKGTTNVLKNQDPMPEKKPFDKKTWRLQKYSKKYKLQQWEDKRKQTVLRGYYKTLKEDEPKLDVKKIYEEYQDDESTSGEDDASATQKTDKKSKTVAESSFKPSNLDNEDAKFADVPQNSKNRKNKAFKKAHLEFQRIKEEKQTAKEEALKKRAEREEALKEYKRKKSEKFKRLSKRTRKGQPIMKDRIEMMLESIQKSLENE